MGLPDGLADSLRDACYGVAGAVSAPVWGWSLWRTGKWRTDWRGKRGFVPNGLISPQSHGDTKGESSRDSASPGVPGRADGPGRILLHAVSVGEANLIRGLVAKLVEQGVKVVVSVTTDTGWATAQRLYGEMPGVSVVRYPLDFSWMVERFLEAVKPDVVGLVELEVWPGFVAACKRRGIAVGVVNGRLSEKSYGRYGLPGVKGLVRGTFARLDFVAAQNAAYAERFVGLGVAREKVAVLDTMKWDTAAGGMDDALREQAAKLAREIGLNRGEPRRRGGAEGEIAQTLSDAGEVAGTPHVPGEEPSTPSRQDAKTPSGEKVVVLGSTGDGEEERLTRRLRKETESSEVDVQVLVVPRKPERFDQVATALRAVGWDVARRSLNQSLQDVQPVNRTRVMLVDTMGELRACYALADVAIVGRSFNGWGGSDPMEPAGLGVPTMIGPDHKNFESVVMAMIEANGLIVAPSWMDAAETTSDLLDFPELAQAVGRAGKRVIEEHRGATDRHVALLMDWLSKVKQAKQAKG
ncbi:MAG: glycosyltransferase N-terminal domain-containing protein [Planctomycetota bacterium]